MTNKFLLIAGGIFVAAGLSAAIFGLGIWGTGAPTTMIDSFMEPGSFARTSAGFMLFSGALYMLFLGMRSGYGVEAALLASCQAMIGILLASQPESFSSGCPAASAIAGLISIAIMLIGSGALMIVSDGRHAISRKLAVA